MAILQPSPAQFVPDGQDTVFISRLPDNPTAGVYYTVADSTIINVLKPYTNQVLLFDGTDYLVQSLSDGGSILIGGVPQFYSPGSGFVPQTSFGVSGAQGIAQGGSTGGGGGITGADVVTAIDASVDIQAIADHTATIETTTLTLDSTLQNIDSTLSSIDANNTGTTDVVNELQRTCPIILGDTDSTAAIEDTSAAVIGATANNVIVIIQNTGSETAYLRVGTDPAQVGNGFTIEPGDDLTLTGYAATQAVQGVTEAGLETTLYVYRGLTF